MFILPFIHEIVNQGLLRVHTIKVLTVGGRDLWQERDGLKLNKDILNPNDIYARGKPIRVDKQMRFCAVDAEKTRITDFYTWNELDAEDRETYCWRTFVYLAADKECWLTIPDTEKLGSYLVRDIVKIILDKKEFAHTKVI